MLTLDNIHDPAGDIQEHQMFCLIADKIEADPGLLSIALENVERWLNQGHFARRRLEQWRKLVTDAQQSRRGLAALTSLLRDDSESARLLKGFAPFPGVLNREDVLSFHAFRGTDL